MMPEQISCTGETQMSQESHSTQLRDLLDQISRHDSVICAVEVSEASVVLCTAMEDSHGVGGLVKLSCGEGGGAGGEFTGFTGQSQLPQGIQGVHLCSP